MKCPKCNSQRVVKNGRRRPKQCYKCRDCGRQFVESPIEQSYPPEIRQRERISVLVSFADTGAKHRSQDVSKWDGFKRY